MRAYGAKVILTPAAARGTGMVQKAKELAEKHGWFLAPASSTNPANPAYHRQTTAAEILRDFAGKRLDVLRQRLGHRRHPHRRGRSAQAGAPGHPHRRHRAGRRRPAQGRCVGSRTRSRAGRRTSCPRCSTATSSTNCARSTDEDAIATSRRLAAEEGIFVGISAGATAAAALQIAETAPEGSVLLAMLPDTGERYFSSPLFADINEGSDDEWLASLG